MRNFIFSVITLFAIAPVLTSYMSASEMVSEGPGAMDCASTAWCSYQLL